MESCSCGHKQQVPHLKSRISQLEIMLDKAHKRINAAAQASSSSGSPLSNMPSSAPRPITSADVRRSDEYRRLQADLESERRVKMDLMANLKELTTSNEAAQARLVQELTDVRAQHETTMSSLDEIQEEFDRLRITYSADRHDSAGQSASATEDALPDSPTNASHSVSGIDSEARISASVIRSFASQLDKTQEVRMRNLMLNIAQQCPKDLCNSMENHENESLEMQLLDCVSLLSARYVDNQDVDKLKSVLSKCGEQARSTKDPSPKVLIADLSTAFDKQMDHVKKSQEALLDMLYRSVPATLQDLSGLLSRASSFTFPQRPATAKDLAVGEFEDYLKTVGLNLSHTIRKYISSHQKSRQKLSYRSFTVGELALFLPTRHPQSTAWAAFNVGAPHYFLDMEGVETKNKDFMIGRIQEITERTGEPGVDPVTAAAAAIAATANADADVDAITVTSTTNAILTDSDEKGDLKTAEVAAVEVPPRIPEIRKWWQCKIQEKKRHIAI